MRTAWEFLRAIARNLVALMSGIASLALMLIANVWGASRPGLWWAASHLCLLIAAYLVWKSEWGKPGPEVIVKYETKNKIQPDNMDMRVFVSEFKRITVGEEDVPRFMLQNQSEIVAMNVTVHQISLNKQLVEFAFVPSVTKGAAIDVQASRDLAECLRNEWLSGEEKDLIVPISVSYSDTQGRKFETDCEIKYSGSVTMAIFKGIRRIGNRPKWPTCKLKA